MFPRVLLLWLLPAWFFLMSTQLPSLQRTWQIVGNVTLSGVSGPDQHLQLLYTLKQTLKTMPLSPWTVVGSSNGVAFGIDGVDRWLSKVDCNTFSWIVLKQTGLTSNFQWLIRHGTAGGSPYTLDVFLSPNAGFTGGGVFTRPTATDELFVDAFNSNDTDNGANIFVNVAVSTDGKATRWWVFQQGMAICWGLIELLSNPTPQLTTPWIAFREGGPNGSSSGALTYANLSRATLKYGRQGVTTLAYVLSSDKQATTSLWSGQDTAINSAVNQLSGDYPIAPVAVACTTSSHRGMVGELADVWFGSETAANGDTYPEAAFAGAGGLDQFVQVGDLILPWIGTVPLTGGAAGTRRPGRVINQQQTYTAPGGTLPIVHSFGFGGSTGAELATVSPVYTSGAVWFVSSTGGTDAAAPAGKSREAPLASLGQAQTNASAGDVIVVLASHAEVLGVKLTLSKAGLAIIGEGLGINRPTFSRSADVNLFDLTGAGIRLENIRFITDAAAGYTSDRVLVSANSCIVRGDYFASGVNDSASPALAVASGVTNLTIDGATYFVSSGTSRTATGYRGLSLKGTATDLEVHDVIFDGGTYGWLSNAWNATGAVTRLRAKDVDLISGSDVVLASSTTGYFHIRAESGAARLEWP